MICELVSLVQVMSKDPSLHAAQLGLYLLAMAICTCKLLRLQTVLPVSVSQLPVSVSQLPVLL